MIIMFFVAVIVGNFWRLELPGQFLWFILKASPFNIYLVITINIPACLSFAWLSFFYSDSLFLMCFTKSKAVFPPQFSLRSIVACVLRPSCRFAHEWLRLCQFWQFFYPSWTIIILKGGAANGNYIRFWALW